MTELVSIGRDTTEVHLFDTKGGIVTLYTSPTFEGQMAILKKYEGKDDMESQANLSIDSIIGCFVDWNLGKDGVKLECTSENVKKLSQRDIFALIQACTGQHLIDENGVILSKEASAKKAVSA